MKTERRLRVNRHELDTVDRYLRRKHRIQQREKAMAELRQLVLSREFLVPLVVVYFAVVLAATALTALGVI